MQAKSVASNHTPAVYYPPPEAQGGWRSLVPVGSGPKSSAEPNAAQKQSVRATTGLDWDQLNQVWAYCLSFGGPHNLLVIRHGWIAGEWANYTGTEQSIASCTKSLTGLAMARLFDLSDAGQLPRPIHIEDEAWRFLPAAWAEAEPARKHIRLRHLLTMTSGLTPFDGPFQEDYLETIFAQQVEAAPGTLWAYSSASVDLLSLVIEAASGRTLEAFFNAEIDAAVGAAPSRWELFSGHANGSGATHCTARDLARLGYLVLHNGVWGAGEAANRVVSAERLARFTRHAAWLDATTCRQPNFAFEPNANRYYGQLWWTNHTGEALGGNAPHDVVYMSGWGKQACFVAPGLDMIAIRLGRNATLNEHPYFYHDFWSRLMAAFTDRSEE
jgi:CubicO group peptidase (beta-lactamase class C family)